MLNPRRPAVADPCNQIFPDAFYKTPIATPLFPLSHTSCLATTTNTETDAANTARQPVHHIKGTFPSPSPIASWTQSDRVERYPSFAGFKSNLLLMNFLSHALFDISYCFGTYEELF
jgi:hypothetical protein